MKVNSEKLDDKAEHLHELLQQDLVSTMCPSAVMTTDAVVTQKQTEEQQLTIQKVFTSLQSKYIKAGILLKLIHHCHPLSYKIWLQIAEISVSRHTKCLTQTILAL